MKNIIISALITSALIITALNVPAQWLYVEGWFNNNLGAAVITLTGGDVLSNFPAIYNANLNALNTDKLDIASTTFPNLATADGLTSATSLTSVGTITTGTWNSLFDAALIDGDDINSNIAGRSLTLTSASPDTLDADVELYTKTFSINLASTTLSTTTQAAKFEVPLAFTITNVTCSTDVGTTTIQLDERTEGSENVSGTDIMTSQLVCGSGTDINNTTLFDNAGISARNLINLGIDKTDDQEGGLTPTVVDIYIRGTFDD